MAKKLVKRGSEVTSNSDAICKVTGIAMIAQKKRLWTIW